MKELKEFSIRIDDYFIDFKVVHDEFLDDSRYLIIKQRLDGSGSVEYLLTDSCYTIKQIIDKLV